MAVELQLGLALPADPISLKPPPFDLNRSSAYPDDESDASTGFRGSTISNNKMKRTFDNSSDSECDSAERTLPLLLWNKRPKDDDDLPNLNRTCNLNLIMSEEETEGIVGWPPIKSYWKKQRGHDQAAARNFRARGFGGYHYVKVQIDGVLITRKIVLNPHQSSEALTSAILYMFGRGHQSVDDYSLTCQDRQGDWLPAAHMTWRTFIESAQRLRLVKKED